MADSNERLIYDLARPLGSPSHGSGDTRRTPGNARHRGDQGQDSRHRRSVVHDAGLRGDELALDHRGSAGESCSRQLSLRQQGGVVPVGADAKARPDEPAARRPAHAARARCRNSRTSVREDPRCTARARARAGARSRARWNQFPAPARTRLRGPGAVHPPIPERSICRDDRSLQGGLRPRTSRAAEARALVAPAFHDGRVVVHARRHRCAETDRRARTRRRPERRATAAPSGTVPARGVDVAASGRRRQRSRAGCVAGCIATTGTLTGRSSMLTLLWLVVAIITAVTLAYVNARGTAWTVSIAVLLAAAWTFAMLPMWVALLLVAAFVMLAPALLLSLLRRKLISEPALRAFRRVLPAMSQTEREALEAGTVWWDGELFSGAPDWRKLLDVPRATLSPGEQSFLDNEVETLAGMVSDWETTNVYRDLPPAVWQYIKDNGFLGMIIPKAYGGLGFSAFAHSEVVQKLSTRSGTIAVTVLVPNSLGPGELLLNYGTEAQKRHFLPRLAKGLEIPCFALTNPYAGSDAASIPDYGIVCWGEHEGARVLGLRLTWDKRYITLGPVATLLGLAFRAYDPDHLVGAREDLGISCALVPTSHAGVNIGRRHMPLNAVFQNGPNSGRDVFIPMDWIIGGQPMLGRGWRMLMECLAAGRGISLPSSNTGMAKLAVRATGGYARIRRQFRIAIGRFEGIEEPLARMGGNVYLMDATRQLTARAVDLGEKPAVLSGIAKLHLTERNREVINDAMDIAGGKGICMGPSNFLGAAYMQIPVSITVEGANILTRSLIVFGQGAIRCHPYVLKEMRATQHADGHEAVVAFDDALVGHVRFAIRNLARAFVMGLTGSHFVRVPADVDPDTMRYYQQLTRFSAALAFLAYVSMGVLGGELKRKEKLSARLGDILSCLYLCSATLKRFEDEGRQAADAPLMHWAIWDAMFKAQNAFEGVISNFPSAFVAGLVRAIVFPLGRPYVVPSDALGRDVARLLIAPSPTRDRLTAGMFLPDQVDDPVRQIELALDATMAAEPIEAKLREAVRAGRLPRVDDPRIDAETLDRQAIDASVITPDEARVLAEHRKRVAQVVRVDDFGPDLGTSLLRVDATGRAADVASVIAAAQRAPA